MKTIKNIYCFCELNGMAMAISSTYLK